MQATLTWLDLTASDRDKMRRVLDLFKEQGTLDEMGLGSLRDALSDALFPGTSSIQTRLRYMACFVAAGRLPTTPGIASTTPKAAEIRAVRLLCPLTKYVPTPSRTQGLGGGSLTADDPTVLA